MASLSAVVTEVGILSGRPEWTSVIQAMIRSTLVELHGIEVWRRDHRDQYVVFPQSRNEQVLPLVSLPRYKALSYAAKWDPTGLNLITSQTTGAAGDRFTEISPDKVLDDYRLFYDNKFYISNAAINFRSWTPFQYMLVGYYQRPQIEDDTIYSWIADEYPEALSFGAAAKVAGDSGDTEMEARLRANYATQLEIIRTTNIEAVAR